MSVRIVIDSTADIPARLKNRFTIVPLSILFGDEEYIDGVSIDHKRFYEKLIESDVMPTTSQATPEPFLRIFREAAQAGDTVVVLTLASALSGTYQSAMIAAGEYPGTVWVVDSESVAIGTGILAQLALQFVEEGLDAPTIAGRLKVERDNVSVIAVLDTLEYLKKGGRISKTAAFAGGLLNIKPVITIKKGEILILGKARGSRQSNNYLIQEIEKAGGVNFQKPLLLGYTGLSDAMLQKYIEDSAALWEGNTETLEQTIIGSVIGTHAGPGAIAVAFFKN